MLPTVIPKTHPLLSNPPSFFKPPSSSKTTTSFKSPLSNPTLPKKTTPPAPSPPPPATTTTLFFFNGYNLKTLQWNNNGITSKIDERLHSMEKGNIPIAAIQETKLTKNSKPFKTPNYTLV